MTSNLPKTEQASDTHTSRIESEHAGLLEVKERIGRVDLAEAEAEETPGDELRTTGAASGLGKLFKTMTSLVVLIALSYGLPSWVRGTSVGGLSTPIKALQPWQQDEDFIPFWNVIGREFMGHGTRAEKDAAKTREFEALARLAANHEQADMLAAKARAAEARKSKTQKSEVLNTDGLIPEMDLPTAGDRYPIYTVAPEHRPSSNALLENGEALHGFYEALASTDLGVSGAITRVGHFGDSVLGNDGITSAIRRRMQARFGDAGHGFHSLVKYDASYRHRGVRFDSKTPWLQCYIIRGCREDGRYGYGGSTVWSNDAAESRFRTSLKGSFGTTFSRFELWYARQTYGGKIRLKVDDAPAYLVDTRLSASESESDVRPERGQIEDAWELLEFDDGPHSVVVRAGGGRSVRAYGVVMEREGPGVVWDGVALIGAFVSRLLNQDAEHLASQIAHRDLDLLVFMFGGNDMARERGVLRETMAPLETEYRAAIERMRAGKPGIACVVMAPVDHGERAKGGIVSRSVVPRMVEAQRRVAEEEGCAFFDTWTAMGGDGSAARWFRSDPRLLSGDLAHPTLAGHNVIGSMFYDALMRGYDDFRRDQAGKPMPKR